MITIEDYNNPFDVVTVFEEALAEYTGAPYVVTTDCCSHAMELCFRWILLHTNPYLVTIPNRTYLSVPMVFHKLGMQCSYKDIEWKGEYRIEPTIVWDSARKLTHNMYKQGQFQCLSFGRTKPLEIGRGGAILLDNKEAYNWLKRASYDGRDLSISPWQNQKEFQVGYHYMMRPEECIIGLDKLNNNDINTAQDFTYPDVSRINIDVTQR